MRRGDIVTAAFGGDYGKPRPALVVQSDVFDETSSVTVLLLTGTLQDAPLLRVSIAPSEGNGLRAPSQIMIDRLVTIPRTRVGAVIGRIEDGLMTTLGRHMATFLDLY